MSVRVERSRRRFEKVRINLHNSTTCERPPLCNFDRGNSKLGRLFLQLELDNTFDSVKSCFGNVCSSFEGPFFDSWGGLNL